MGPEWNPAEGVDAVAVLMAVEEAIGRSLSDEEWDRLLPEIAERIARGEFGDDDVLAAAVRKPKPGGPRGKSGGTAVPAPPDSDQ